MISYLLPTRNRPSALRATLAAIGGLPRAAHESVGGAEVIVVDNASRPPVALPARLDNGAAVRVIRQAQNAGAAARNTGAAAAAGDWLIMLDDDSHPLDVGHLDLIAESPQDVAAIGADIRLPDGRREAGGLPEVFVGCGAAVRRDAFLDVDGYDPGFGFYGEEYDLCAKLIRAGWRIVHDLRFGVRHRKVTAGRDRNRILQCLVRNNGWVMQRYAPLARRQDEIGEILVRYANIAVRESAGEGYARGVGELLATCAQQPSREMADALFDRFTGLAHARAGLGACDELGPGVRVALVDEGKNAHVVRAALGELGVELVEGEGSADVLVIGTLSPGPMLDAL
ncbi:MAG: glycosyltransferase family 2 protein, partial [Planctomycetota bacterium]